MAALDDLSPDRRAVLQLLVARGRGYDQIAELLHLPEIVVRRRSHDALTELAGGAGQLEDGRRALLCDYLVGELPASRRAEARLVLADDPAARRFARSAAARLSGIPGAQLPELPAEDEEVAEALDALDARRERKVEVERSSRTGAWLLVGGIAVAVIAAVVLLSVFAGGGSSDTPVSNTADTPAAETAAATTASTFIVNLASPSGGSATGKAALRPRTDGATDLAAEITGLPKNDTDAYAFWLEGPNTDPLLLGFYDRTGDPSPAGEITVGIRLNGQSVPAVTAADLDDYDQLVVSREDSKAKDRPTTPTSVVLQGTIAVANG
ncbi:MAG: sigma factor-like helix-turn-helix DNA-binding protein [Patulibacter minatonensis]